MNLLLLVTLIDGSCINLNVNATESVEFATEFGVIRVPFNKIAACDIGVHTEEQGKIDGMIASLGDSNYAKRDLAMKWLKAWRRQAYPQLVANLQHKDPEVQKRVQQIVAAGMVHRIGDKIVFKSGAIDGTLIAKHLRGVSPCLGELKIPLTEIAGFQTRTDKRKVIIKAGDAPVDCGFVAGAAEIKIRASGHVDLYPITPGAYTCDPNGYSQQVDGYNSGALLGRIDGRTFLVGTEFTTFGLRGRLELFIQRAPEVWVPFCPATGSYEVEIE